VLHTVRVGGMPCEKSRGLATSMRTLPSRLSAPAISSASSEWAPLVALITTAEALDGKVLIDVANPLDFSHGMPPTLTVCNTDSLGEQIQRRFPAARVVKTLNTVSTDVMVDPGRVPGGHTMFVCGDDPAAKETATGLLVELGWTRDDVMDLGDITACRGTEMYLPLWLCLRARAGSTLLNIRVVSR